MAQPIQEAGSAEPVAWVTLTTPDGELLDTVKLLAIDVEGFTRDGASRWLGDRLLGEAAKHMERAGGTGNRD